jgi:L-aminopeptidase/D-esterase-like protein
MIEARKLAEACHIGITDVIYPAHTVYDGDLTIVSSMGDVKENLSTLALVAQRAVSESIANAVEKAKATPGLPAYRDLHKARH